LASAAGGTGAVAAALVLLFGAATTPPAFAVTRNSDGTLTVKFLNHSQVTPAEMTALNHALANAHAKLRFVPTGSGITVRCPDGRAARSVTLRPALALTIGTDGSGRPADLAANGALANARRAAGKSDAGHTTDRTRALPVQLRWNCAGR
jgi:hypothetical protein